MPVEINRVTAAREDGWAEHIEEGYRKACVSEDEAERALGDREARETTAARRAGGRGNEERITPRPARAESFAAKHRPSRLRQGSLRPRRAPAPARSTLRRECVMNEEMTRCIRDLRCPCYKTCLSMALNPCSKRAVGTSNRPTSA